MTTIQSSFRQFSSLLRITLAAALLLSGLTFVSSAQATLLTADLNSIKPDIRTYFDFGGTVNNSSWVNGSDTGSFSANFNGYQDLTDKNGITTSFSAIFDLTYNGVSKTGSLSITDNIGTLLKGDITAVRDDGINKTYFFLVDLDESVTSADMKSAGFGPMAGVIFSDATGFSADTFNVPVPEPTTVVLLAAGLAGLVVLRRRRN